MPRLDILIADLKTSHTNKTRLCRIAGRTASAADLDAWNKKTKLTLPPDFCRFLCEVGPCTLHTSPEFRDGGQVHFLDLDHIVPVGPLILDDHAEIPAAWFAIADMNDGNYLVMDLSDAKGERVDILDAFHETIPYEATIIARSFTEFLERMMQDSAYSIGGGGGKEFWSKFECYGDKGIH